MNKADKVLEKNLRKHGCNNIVIVQPEVYNAVIDAINEAYNEGIQEGGMLAANDILSSR